MRLFNAVAAGLPAKTKKDLPAEIRRGIAAVTRVEAGINPTLVGTAKHKKAFFGDVDLLASVQGDPDEIALGLQNIAKNLPKHIYFSDCKVGGTKKAGRHWTKRQIISGKNGTLTLKKAIRQKAITKLDVILPIKTKFGKRFVEMTNFIYIPGVSAPFGDFQKEMQKDIVKYSKKNRKLKVVKRKLSSLLWTDKKSDQKEIRRLFAWVKGEAGYLGTLLADCETARLLVKNKQMQKEQLAYLSKARGQKITMRTLKKLEEELGSEINKIIT